MAKRAKYTEDGEPATVEDTKTYLVLNDQTAIEGVVYNVGDTVQLTEECATLHRERGVPLGEAPDK